MRAVELDFQTSHRIAWPGWALLAVALGMAGVLAERFVALKTQVAIAEERLDRLKASARGMQQDAKATRQHGEELQRVRMVNRQLTLPWGALFESVEQAATQRIALLGLQPDAAQNIVRITAETRELTDALEFVRRLEATRRLRAVHLASHQVQEHDPRRPIRFVVVGAFERERKL